MCSWIDIEKGASGTLNSKMNSVVNGMDNGGYSQEHINMEPDFAPGHRRLRRRDRNERIDYFIETNGNMHHSICDMSLDSTHYTYGPFRWILIALAIFGFFHFRHGPYKKIKWLRIFTQVYSFVVSLICLIYVILTLVVSFTDKETPDRKIWMQRINGHIYSVHRMGCVFFLMVMVTRRGGLNKLYEALYIYKISTTIQPDYLKSKRVLSVVALIILLCVSVIVIAMSPVYVYYSMKEEALVNTWKTQYGYFEDFNTFSVLYKIISYVQIIMLIGSLLMVGLLTQFGYAFRLEMQNFVQVFADSCRNPVNEERVIELYRDYNHLAQTVCIADQIFRVYMAFNIGLLMPAISILTYNMIFPRVDTTMLSFVVIDLILLVGSCMAAALFHRAMQSIWCPVTQVDVTILSDKVHNVVTTIIQRLAAAPIGITAWGYFIINDPCVLTVVGTIITYVIVVLELGSKGGSTCACLCQNSTDAFQFTQNISETVLHYN